jgi:hypothetical protein
LVKNEVKTVILVGEEGIPVLGENVKILPF